MEIALSQARGYLRVDVRDNGVGIDVADQELIFELFRRAGDSLAGKPHGTGLGLHICRRIVERLNGRIWVESGRSGDTCISFTLPLAP